jgi:hypothetical protein
MSSEPKNTTWSGPGAKKEGLEHRFKVGEQVRVRMSSTGEQHGGQPAHAHLFIWQDGRDSGAPRGDVRSARSPRGLPIPVHGGVRRERDQRQGVEGQDPGGPDRGLAGAGVSRNDFRLFPKDSSRKGAKGSKFGKDIFTADLRRLTQIISFLFYFSHSSRP